jgi:hypothetical protein
VDSVTTVAWDGADLRRGRIPWPDSRQMFRFLE